MVKSILILQETLSHYNVPLFESLCNNYNITIGFTNKNESIDSFNNFKTIKIETQNFLGFKIAKGRFFKTCNEFDVVITMPDLHHISYCLLPFLNLRCKVISWTIGIRASYKIRYNLLRRFGFLDLIYCFILKKCDALIFYRPEPLLFWGRLLNQNKVFIANNSVEIKHSVELKREKKSLLFIGTLYKEKKIMDLIYAYFKAVMIECNKNAFIKLKIIGDGPEYNKLKNTIDLLNLNNNIQLLGSIYAPSLIESHFNDSLICISPDQAGLSVLTSLGHGVPFVTNRNSITGGERFNIINGFNGLLYDSQKDLVNIIFDVNKNRNKYLEMGKNALKYYEENATINHMKNGFIQAINYVN